MSFRLPGSTLLDRIIGRNTSTYSYTNVIRLSKIQKPIHYKSFTKALSKFRPSPKLCNQWSFINPFGRSLHRIELGSGRRTLRIHGDSPSILNSNGKHSDSDNEKNSRSKSSTHLEIFEYSVGSIRNSIFIINNYNLLSNKILNSLDYYLFAMADFLNGKNIHLRFLNQLLASKAMHSKNFTSTQTNMFAKWSSSIFVIRVLNEKLQNAQQLKSLMTKCNEENIEENRKQRLQSINISKDIDFEIRKEKEMAKERKENLFQKSGENNNRAMDEMQSMKDIDIENIEAIIDENLNMNERIAGENQSQWKDESFYELSDFVRNFNVLMKFDTNFYECEEQYLVMEMRYVIPYNTNERKYFSKFIYWVMKNVIYLPHWMYVKRVADKISEEILCEIEEFLVETSNNIPSYDPSEGCEQKKMNEN